MTTEASGRAHEVGLRTNRPPVASNEGDSAGPKLGVAGGKPLRVLFADDSEDDVALVQRELRRNGYVLTWERVQDATSMREALISGTWDLVLSDWSMPRFGALGALAVVKEAAPDIPLIIVSGTIGEDGAVAALRAGALDFVPKDKLSRLSPAIERELRETQVRVARRRAEDDLRASEARYRALFESTPLPMWVYDTQTFKILTVNEAALRHYGYGREEFAKLTLADLQPSADSPTLREGVTEPETGDAATIWRHRKKDGSIIEVEVKADEVDFEGKRARLVVANDVTERERVQHALRKTEDQIRQLQKMEAVGRLAGSVAHDFNNLLSVILSYASLLLKELREGDPMRADLEEIENAGNRAADLTKQLLAFSRHQSIAPVPLDVNGVLGGMDKMLRRIAGGDVDVVMQPAAALAPILSDRGHIEQIIMNLVVNARDAMPTGGKVVIETANVVLDEDYARSHLGATPGPHVMIAVTDSGTGMDKDTQARIFEPFFTTKEPGKGTGLGLSTVFGIVQKSDGSIWVESEPGRGTIFQIYFPLADADVSDPVPAVPPRSVVTSGSETILLVEDEESVRAVAGDILRRSGYQVLEASNAGEALLICESHETIIHLVLSDIVLPKVSGPEMFARLRLVRPGLRVLFMSGYTGEVVHRGVVGSEFSFIQKPLRPDLLCEGVREVLGDGRSGSPDHPRNC
ncbi:MAG: response regulator [Polyangiaceae bacterium]|jgi:two-component system, cell cycle sensor histidine kinase and response regulator CckA